MKGTSIVISAFLFVWATVGMSSAEDKKPDPREKPETAVAEAIRLLEKKEHVDFLKKFVAPDDLKGLTKRITFDQFAKEFAGEKADKLLKALKQVEDGKPELDKEMKEAVFKLKEDVGEKDSITFKKVDKYWYIKN